MMKLNDSNCVLGTINRKGMIQTTKEDVIILRERENKVDGFADRAAIHLEGRNAK